MLMLFYIISSKYAQTQEESKMNNKQWAIFYLVETDMDHYQKACIIRGGTISENDVLVLKIMIFPPIL